MMSDIGSHVKSGIGGLLSFAKCGCFALAVQLISDLLFIAFSLLHDIVVRGVIANVKLLYPMRNAYFRRYFVT
jgi:hypothetical protein